ncbi:MAG: hypothetical protein P1U82_17805, partial [Verrucomicrobiales bacterium]|nr:hypothetical protein [Verrucomicrobiales bacterium]
MSVVSNVPLSPAALKVRAISPEAPGASVLDLGDDEDLVVTDETLEEAAEALGDAESFEPELNENEDFDF